MISIAVGVIANPQDEQESIICAWIQLEDGGLYYKLEEHPEPVHQISAFDLLALVGTWQRLAERIGAKFEADEAKDYAKEIEQEG